jgi:hypothetical protein
MRAVLPGNDPRFRSKAFAQRASLLRLKRRFTCHTGRKPTAKPKYFIQSAVRECAAGIAYSHTNERPICSIVEFTNTTDTDRTKASMERHQSVASWDSQQPVDASRLDVIRLEHFVL